MEAQQKQTGRVAKHRAAMSAIVMVFLLGAFYLLGGTLLTLAARAFGWSGPGFENAVLALSLPYLAAVWWSHALVMDRIDKLG